MRNGQFVRFTRLYESGFIRGYVMDVGTDFFMLAQTGDSPRFDGFGCFRLAHVRNLNADPYTVFAEAAMKKLKVKRPKKPNVIVATLEELLLSANKSFPLVTIHREKIHPDSCWIGRIESASKGWLRILEIGPDAKWDLKPSSYKLSEVTAVEFGGEYEHALHLVGGRAPRR
jgi:hypothetical protein